ncbi:MAG: hypothetical protein V3T41_02030 [bacterium]
MRRFVIGIVTIGLTLALVAPVFATGKQVVVGTRSGGNYIPFWGQSYNACRFQTLIDKSQINNAGVINEVEFFRYWTTGGPGTFNNVRIFLGHTALSALTTTFDSNYKDTPVEVATISAFVIPTAQAWFPLKMSKTWTYNNTDNMIVEVRWSTDSGLGVPIYSCSFGSGTHRVYNMTDPNARTGTASTLAYHSRLSFSYSTAVTPTSLGRVKAIFE